MEAELNGICKAATEGLGAAHLSQELGAPEFLKIFTDSSAARAVVQRQGAGKVKHLEIKQLWAQEQERQEKLEIQKVPRDVNWSDLLTHHWTKSEGEALLRGMQVVRREATAEFTKTGSTGCSRGGVSNLHTPEPLNNVPICLLF